MPTEKKIDWKLIIIVVVSLVLGYTGGFITPGGVQVDKMITLVNNVEKIVGEEPVVFNYAITKEVYVNVVAELEEHSDYVESIDNVPEYIASSNIVGFVNVVTYGIDFD